MFHLARIICFSFPGHSIVNVKCELYSSCHFVVSVKCDLCLSIAKLFFLIGKCELSQYILFNAELFI
jgi:hypothetical protein